MMAAGPGGGVLSGCSHDLGGRHPGDLRGALRCIVTQEFAQFLETLRVSLHEVSVV